MKKIGLYLGTEPNIGGTFQYSQNMLDAVASLPSDEFETVAAYTPPRWRNYLAAYPIRAAYFPNDPFSRSAAASWQTIGLPLSTWRKHIAPVAHRLSRLFLAERCDLWVFPGQDKLAYGIPVPAVSSIHDLMHRYEASFPEVSDGREYRRRERLYGNLCRWSQAVLVDSETGRRQVCESYGISKDRVKVLPFTAPKYIHAQDPPSERLATYDLPDNYVLYPAQFWEHKNHKALIRAAKAILPQAPDIHLVFAGGKKNAYESTMTLAKQLGMRDRVHVLGYVPDQDMPALYDRARCLMMPTFFGPTNIPPLEAFARSCPAAVSNIYGMPEQVGDAALLFDPNSDHEISEAMLKLWKDGGLREELIRKAKTQREKYSQDNFNLRLTEILRETISA